MEQKTVTGGNFLQEQVHSFTKQQASEAFQQLRMELRQAERRGDKDATSWAYLNTAMVFRGQRQYSSALHVLEKARAGFEATTNEAGMASTYEELSCVNRELNRNTLALDYSFKAARLFQTLNRPLELAWSYDNMAIVLFNLFRPQESLLYAKKARAIFSKYKIQSCMAWNACNLGNLYFEMGLYTQAKRYYNEANTTFSKLQIKQGEAWSLLWLGMLSRALSQFSQAEEFLEKSRIEFKALGFDDRVGWCMLNQAAIKWLQDQGDKAIVLNKNAIQLFGPLKNRDGVAWGLFQLARIQRDQGFLVKAWKTIRKALELYDHIANQKGFGWAESEWGQIYLALGDEAHAYACFSKAKEKADQLGVLPLRAEVEKNLALYHLDQGQLEKGLGCLKIAEALCKKINSMESYVDVLLAQTRYALVMGNPTLAHSSLDKTAELIKAYGLIRFQPALEVCRGELFATKKDFIQAQKIFSAVAKGSTRTQHRYQMLEAALGWVQMKWITSSAVEAAALLKSIGKEIRILGSRKLKIKYLFLKTILDYKNNGVLELGVISHNLKALDEQGLVLLKLHFLSMLEEVCRNNGDEREAANFQAERNQLLQNSAYDLRLAHPRHDMIAVLPVSLVI